MQQPSTEQSLRNNKSHGCLCTVFYLLYLPHSCPCKLSSELQGGGRKPGDCISWLPCKLCYSYVLSVDVIETRKAEEIILFLALATAGDRSGHRWPRLLVDSSTNTCQTLAHQCLPAHVPSFLNSGNIPFFLCLFSSNSSNILISFPALPQTDA